MKHEQRFCNLMPGPEPNEVGRQQFHDHQSHGIKPENPDPYYIRLCQGKSWWDWSVDYHRSSFFGTPTFSGEPPMQWSGWHLVLKDFKNDMEAFNMIFGTIIKRLRAKGLYYEN